MGSEQAAQGGGDQFLDGIGETSLTARYGLENNAEDSSRNQFHATLRGTASFVEDPLFRRALLLTGDGSYLQLPANTLDGEDTISVTGWLFLPTGASGPVFDFGRDAANRLFATASREGLRASAVVNGAVQGERHRRRSWPRTSGCTSPWSSILRRARCRRTSTARGSRRRRTSTSRRRRSLGTGAGARLFLGRSQQGGRADAPRAGCATCASIASRSATSRSRRFDATRCRAPARRAAAARRRRRSRPPASPANRRWRRSSRTCPTSPSKRSSG